MGQGEFDFPEREEYERGELLRLEKSVCGVYLSGHPLADQEKEARRLGAAELLSFVTEPEQYRDGDSVLLYCLIGKVTQKQIKSGDRMAFLRVEDQTGETEVILFPKVFAAASSLLTEDRVVVIRGQINLKDEEIKVIAQKVMTPEEAEEEKPAPRPPKRESAGKQKPPVPEKVNFSDVHKIYLRFPEKDSIMERRATGLLGVFPGAVPVFFFYEDSRKLYRADGLSVHLTPLIHRELCEILGKENVGLITKDRS